MTPKRPVLIANCSGFYGDRLAAAKEMVEGGPIDFLTGDYLAELTMLILWKARQKDPGAGYAKTFLTQMEQVLSTCLDRGIRIVSNAGGLNPPGLAAELARLSERLGLKANIAYIEGDDISASLPSLMERGNDFANLDTKVAFASGSVAAITANAYLGAWGIVEALKGGADIVVCGRVTDASLAVGPAAYWHDWARSDLDELAGAVVAGHIIECGPQATGGNYSFIDEITDRRYPGFPIAEIAADGSAVITKHPGTGGLVSVGTVTAQLLYEIAEPQYLNPDVVAHFDTIALTQQSNDRVLVSRTRGTLPPSDLKVALNYLGGYKNTMTLVITGLDIEKKAQWAQEELFGILGGKENFGEVDVRLIRFDRQDAPSNELATAHLRITLKDKDPAKVGRAFSNAVMELALGGYAGFHTTTTPSSESAYGIYWPTLVPAAVVEHRAVLPDGSTVIIDPSASEPLLEVVPRDKMSYPTLASTKTRLAPLGMVCGARSGDKGGNANVGLWTRDETSFGWLKNYLDVERFGALLPEAAGLEIRRFELDNLCALNFVVVGLLQEGVASSTRPDPQAKGLAEYIRSRYLEIPIELLGEPLAELLDRAGADG